VPFELSIATSSKPTVGKGFVNLGHDASRAGRRRAPAERDPLAPHRRTLDRTGRRNSRPSEQCRDDTGFNRRFSEIWRIAGNFVAVGERSAKLSFRPRSAAQQQSFLARHRELLHKPENESFEPSISGRARLELTFKAPDGRRHDVGRVGASATSRPHPFGRRTGVPGLHDS